MPLVLVIADPAERVAAAAADTLRAAGIAAAVVADGANLVPDALQAAPQAVLWLADVADVTLAARLAALQAARAVPVALVCASIDDEALAAALAAGLHACAIGAAAPDLPALLRVARARFAHEQGKRHELDAARRRLDERKLVDRAKGLLMRGRAMSEDEAFTLLRTASMQAQLRVGEVSERVIEAARHAEAVNRAGRLRMLSQRIVKLAALRVGGVEPADTRTRLEASVAQADEQIDQLRKALADDPATDGLARVDAAWRAMRAALQPPPETARLAAFDATAEQLLNDADALTRAVQAQGLAATLQVVNLCGRQRMLAQRLAKQALLATLLRGPEAQAARDAAAATDDEFQRALAALAALPISTPEIRAGLADADSAWQQLRGGVREAHLPAGRRTVARTSEALLDRFDDLTARYEHSLQVILG